MLTLTYIVLVFLVIFSVSEANSLRHTKGEEEQSTGGTRSLQSQTNSCQQKYILLSTLRSGSTWACSLFDLQEGITCGGLPLKKGRKSSELLFQYGAPRQHYQIEWSDYKSTFDIFGPQSIVVYSIFIISLLILFR